jgi:proteasome lid subunit RPN8/RPN11
MTRPWLEAPLTIDRAVLSAVDEHAIAEYPNESCGFLTGPSAQPTLVDRAIRAVNLADKYHKADPETFPRTAREYYTIDARVIQRTFEQGEREQQPVKLIYHSHCDCGAYFSQTDQDAAAPDGQLAYPVAWMVTSVIDGAVKDRKVFTFRDGAWRELPFSVQG